MKNGNVVVAKSSALLGGIYNKGTAGAIRALNGLLPTATVNVTVWRFNRRFNVVETWQSIEGMVMQCQ